MIGNIGIPRRTEQDRVLAAQRVQSLVRHHHAVVSEIVAAPIEVLELEGGWFLRPGNCLQNFTACGHHFLADAVAWDRRYAIRLHYWLLCRFSCRIAQALALGKAPGAASANGPDRRRARRWRMHNLVFAELSERILVTAQTSAGCQNLRSTCTRSPRARLSATSQ